MPIKMYNLHNKIYETINTRIQKALVIDDSQDNDVSVKWETYQVSNNVNMLNFYVDEMLTCDIKDVTNKYNQICVYCRNNNLTYKVNDLNELNNIASRLKQSYFQNGEIIFTVIKELSKCFDFQNILSFILANGKEADIHNADGTVLFTKIKYNSNELIWHNNLLIFNQMHNIKTIDTLKYNNANCIDDIEMARYDFDGWSNTYDNINMPAYKSYPAYKHFKEMSINGYQAYIPAIGELCVIGKYKELINDIQEFIKNNKYGNNLTHMTHFLPEQGYLTSSTERNYLYTWAYDMYDNDFTSLNNKNINLKYLPLFKKIN